MQYLKEDRYEKSRENYKKRIGKEKSGVEEWSRVMEVGDACTWRSRYNAHATCSCILL